MTTLAQNGYLQKSTFGIKQALKDIKRVNSK